MLIVALVISGLTVRTRAQAEAARSRERRTAALYAMSRELASTRGVTDLLAIAIQHIVEVFPPRGQFSCLTPADAWEPSPFPRPRSASTPRGQPAPPGRFRTMTLPAPG